MKVRKFTGQQSRTVLRDVRTALGPDAVILSTRHLDGGGVEVLAVSDADMAEIVAPAAAPVPEIRPWRPDGMPARDARTANAARPVSRAAPARPVAEPLLDAGLSLPFAPSAPPAATQVAMPAPVVPTLAPPAAVAPVATAPAPVPAAPVAPAVATPQPASPEVTDELKSMRGLLEKQLAVLSQSAAAQKALAQKAQQNEAEAHAMRAQLAQQDALAREVKSMRALLARELAQLSWGDAERRSPVRADGLRRLLAAGFSPALARELTHSLPEGEPPSAIQRWLHDTLSARLPLESAEGIVDRGGIFALVGATGVGKTTTTAKLAARCAMRFGASKLALVTTDGYRVGAHDQLRTFGKLLGVPVQTAQDPTALASLVASLADKHLVLIDTMGLGQRDTRLAECLAALDAAGARRLLLLNAGAQGETLDDVVRAYASERTAGCILTKVDEAVKLGPALDCAIRHRLALHYIANGQRVPEDMHAPNASYLVHRALRVAAEGAFVMDDDQYRLVAQEGAAHGVA